MADVTNLRTNSRLLRESSTLAKVGYQVILLGYNRNNRYLQEETRTNGVTLWELPYAKPTSKSRFGHLFQLLFRDVRFLLTMYWRILFTQAEVYHSHNIYTLPVMWLSARLHRRPLIYDSHELFCEWRKHGPYAGVKKWMLNRFIDLEHILCRRADRVICVSAGIQKILSRVHKIKRPLVIENFPSRSETIVELGVGKLRKHHNLPPDKKIVIFSGGFYRYARLDNLIRISRRFPDVTFVLMGFDSLGYKAELENLAKKIGVTNVVFMNPVPPEEVISYIADANVAVNLYSGDLLMMKYCSSNKTFQYLSAGLPIVGSRIMHSVSEATDGYGVWYPVDPDSLDDLERALREVLSLSPDELTDVKKRAQLCVKERCRWELQEDRFLQLYRSL